MGGGFKCSYTRRRFRRIYVEITSPVRLKLPFKLSKSFTYNTTAAGGGGGSNTGSIRENGSSRQPLPDSTSNNFSPSHFLTVPGSEGGLTGLQTALRLHKAPSVVSHDSGRSTITVGQTAAGGQDDSYSNAGSSNQYFDR
jgi:hypothetical protein